jgi:PIN domain nuclease of toxin-antitoxin system
VNGYLLDTHTLLWYTQEPDNLSPHVIELIRNEKTPVFVSAINLWEMGIKFKTGKLPEAQPLVTGWFEMVTLLQFGDLAFDSRHAVEAGRLEWEHRDPFDRALAAQALVENLTLITRDAAFATFPDVKTLW